MKDFLEGVDAPLGTPMVLQGNLAFALGTLRAGYGFADGYPGTPSTEVLDKGLLKASDRITVQWSVNEATAVSSALGAAMSGLDALVTMKVPGLFQAGDIVSTSAFYHQTAGALVLYVASDWEPSSTQHLVDPRYFLKSCTLPILEPANHQELYDMAWLAADLSRAHHTPVVVLVSSVLCHSEGLIHLGPIRNRMDQGLPQTIQTHLLIPALSRKNYDQSMQVRLPKLSQHFEREPWVQIYEGQEAIKVISVGFAHTTLMEISEYYHWSPQVLQLRASFPLPLERIRTFIGQSREIYVLEEGYRLVQESLEAAFPRVRFLGKKRFSSQTYWYPEDLEKLWALSPSKEKHVLPQAIDRPPALCPGCPYRPFGEAIRKLKKRHKIKGVFGDIGCNTLLMFMDAIDSCACMGASEGMRQGFVKARPDQTHLWISVLGDSTETHSGLDATRNALYRNIPGVKVILDNGEASMTGGQASPTHPSSTFDLKKALEAEGALVQILDAYDFKAIQRALLDALKKARQGAFIVLIIRGPCIQSQPPERKIPTLQVQSEQCMNCGHCLVCPAIERNGLEFPQIQNLCTNCGGNQPLCAQMCPLDAFVRIEAPLHHPEPLTLPQIFEPSLEKSRSWPESIRIMSRGVGGQGILFLGRVLTHLLQPIKPIVKGESHGMAQRGGPVYSTFAWGNVYSPIFVPQSADFLIALEANEIYRKPFLDRLKPNGILIWNQFQMKPWISNQTPSMSLEEIERDLDQRGIHHIPFAGPKLSNDMMTYNVMALGVLSCFYPFDLALNTWYRALTRALQSKPHLFNRNLEAFDLGRQVVV